MRPLLKKMRKTSPSLDYQVTEQNKFSIAFYLSLQISNIKKWKRRNNFSKVNLEAGTIFEKIRIGI